MSNGKFGVVYKMQEMDSREMCEEKKGHHQFGKSLCLCSVQESNEKSGGSN